MPEVKIPKRLQRQMNMSSQKRRATLRKRVLDLWSAVVIAREVRCCAWCGSSDRVQAHHVVARSLTAQIHWFDVRQGMPLCYRCHFHRIKALPDEYIAMRDEWLAERGLDYWKLRQQYATKRQRLTADHLRIIELDLRRQLKTAAVSGVDTVEADA